ncbi:hypothetical protein CK203_075146 [Vitis vinifera]|uniref:28S ribosomal protein S34, mitochondrial n=1 Tax=Vitis vinifera TaxID=29760 RepID=A0A438F9H6_VITVI|nr:hypothetical protein CK203_075146 [Vitis vinifera]
MATAALANRASTDRTWNLLRQSFRFFRSFSAAPSASSSSVASSPNPTASKKPKRRKKKNLFEVAQFLPNWGLGYHMAKTHWTGVSYEITKINLYKDGRHGKAWGLVHKDGSVSHPKELIKDQVKVADASTSSESENKSPRHSHLLVPTDPTTLPLVLYQGKFPKSVELEEVLVEYASTSSESEQGS